MRWEISGIAGTGLLALLVSAMLAQDVHTARGFNHFYNLEYDAALKEFRAAAVDTLQNPNIFNHIAQTILYRELFRVGALESELVSGSNAFLRRPKVNPTAEDQRAFDESITRAMALANDSLARNANDAAALYALGVSYGLRANYNFLVRKAWMDSLRDATNARKSHAKVTHLDPSLVDARMVQGIHEYMVGSLPFFYKMLGFVAGFRGEKQEGIRLLQTVANEGNLNRDDAKILLCVIYRREKRAEDAVPLLTELIPRYPRNYILRLELVQMYSDLGKKESALAVVQDMEKLKHSGAPGYARLPWQKIWFSRGTLLFWYRDLDGALRDFTRVAEESKDLDLNTEVLAWLRLGQTYDLLGRRQEAVGAYERAIRTAPESERAREARNYIRSPYRRKDLG